MIEHNVITVEVKQDNYYEFMAVVKKGKSFEGRQYGTRQQIERLIRVLKDYAAARNYLVKVEWNSK